MSIPLRRRNTQSRAVLLSLSFALIGAACAGQADLLAAGDATKVEAWVTTSDHRWALRPVQVRSEPAGAEAEIEVDVGKRYQRMLGFGASITDSSAWLIQHKMTPDQREALLQE